MARLQIRCRWDGAPHRPNIPHQTPVADPASGCANLTQSQLTALRQVHATGWGWGRSSVNVYTKASRSLCLVGEYHGHGRRAAAAIQEAVRVFPFRGVELYATKLTQRERHPREMGSGGVPLLTRLVGGGRETGTIAARLAHLGHTQLQLVHQCVTAAVVREWRRGNSVEHPLVITLGAGGYARVVSIDGATAETVAAIPRGGWEAVAILGRLLNTGSPVVFLEEEYQPSRWDRGFDWILPAQWTSGAVMFTSFYRLRELRQLPAVAFDEQLQAHIQSVGTTGVVAGLVSVGLFSVVMAMVLLRNAPMPRDVFMARTADRALMANPPAETMLAQVGRAHVAGMHTTLTGALGWEHIGSGTTLFGTR